MAETGLVAMALQYLCNRVFALLLLLHPVNTSVNERIHGLNSEAGLIILETRFLDNTWLKCSVLSVISHLSVI